MTFDKKLLKTKIDRPRVSRDEPNLTEKAKIFFNQFKDPVLCYKAKITTLYLLLIVSHVSI